MTEFEQALRSPFYSITTDPSTGYKQQSPLHTRVRCLMLLTMVPRRPRHSSSSWTLREDLDCWPQRTWNQNDRVETDLNRTNNYWALFNKRRQPAKRKKRCLEKDVSLNKIVWEATTNTKTEFSNTSISELWIVLYFERFICNIIFVIPLFISAWNMLPHFDISRLHAYMR